eukprot:TRINITY_DN35619_c1_g1_i1.p1 TRINITY_DN35619_c1_g1~~TRINITY_DN35619_c1_g1_i1.p1  ORF type:complete len:724 (-),score=159.62 TRINITY_DN35619_c1_g1_i1:73-2244(-)
MSDSGPYPTTQTSTLAVELGAEKNLPLKPSMDTTPLDVSASPTHGGGRETRESKEEVNETIREIEDESSEEFADSFHYATLLRLTKERSLKSYIYLAMSLGLLIFQILALLGFQMRNQYSFCTADTDCSGIGMYCEPTMQICQVKDSNMNCIQSSDCGTDYFCSTEYNQTCVLNDVPCTSNNTCKANQWCSNGKCTNDLVMGENLYNASALPSFCSYSYYADYCTDFGFRSCDIYGSNNTCINENVVDAKFVTNLTEMVKCEYDGYNYEPRCRARLSCPAGSNGFNPNSTCGDWQYCYVDPNGYSSSGVCTDFLGARCIHNDNCSNPYSSTKANQSQYSCSWTAQSKMGICHYYGQVCNQDTDCKAPGFMCNATISYSGSLYGWCYTQPQDNNQCTASKYRDVDLGALIFIACVIAVTVAKDLREAIISEMKLRKLYREYDDIQAISLRKLFCLDEEPHRGKMWVTFLSLLCLEAVLFVRKYMFIPLVVAVTNSVIVDQPANQIILNGVAIFFVVDIDNLFYDFFHDKGEKDVMEEQGKLELKPRESRYLKLISLISAAALMTALIIVLKDKSKILSLWKKCEDPNGLFRYGGLFTIIMLFVGYFLAEILVPILELIWPTEAKKKLKRKGSGLRTSLKEIDWHALATSEGKLHITHQLVAVTYILAQGAAGGGIFWAIVVGYYYTYIGKNQKNFSNTDLYANQATQIYNDIHQSMANSLSGYY